MADRATSHNDRASVAVTVINTAPLDGRPGSFSLDAQVPARGPAQRGHGLKGGKGGQRTEEGYASMDQFMGSRHHGQEPHTLGQAFCQTIFVVPGLLLGAALFAMLLADSNFFEQKWTCPSSHGDLAGALIFPAKTFAQCSILAIVALPIFVTAAHKLTLKGHKFCSVALKVFLLLILLGQFVFAIWMLVAEFGPAGAACDAAEHAQARDFEDAVFVCAAIMLVAIGLTAFFLILLFCGCMPRRICCVKKEIFYH